MANVALLDGSNLIFRSFFATKPLSNSQGIVTNAVYVSLKSFKKIINSLQPDYCIICWDSGKKSFRAELDTSYKAHRPPTSSDLKSQFPILQHAFKLLGVPQITAPDGFECDDLIGTLAKKASNGGMNAIIVSADRDFLQLCDENIKIYSLKDYKFTDINSIKQEYELTPNQLIDVKALTGDKSDNIPGIKGIGPKTAVSLIKKHGNIENLIKETDNKLILANKELIVQYYKLSKIQTDIEVKEIPVKLVDSIKVKEEQLREFFKYYEMQSYLDEFNSFKYLFNYKTSV